jgi:ADP-ribose pyrophosphatase
LKTGCAMSLQDVEIIEQEIVFSGYFQIERFTLRHRLFAGGWSEAITRELFERGKAAAVLLYDPEREQVVMIQQFRVGLIRSDESPWMTEIIAGIVDADDGSDEDVALRETREEAGLEIQAIKPICQYWVSPGGSTEQVNLFCGKVDASLAGGIHGLAAEGEDIRVVVYELQEILNDLAQNKINNSMSIIALQWLQLNHQQLRAEWSKQ